MFTSEIHRLEFRNKNAFFIKIGNKPQLIHEQRMRNVRVNSILKHKNIKEKKLGNLF